MESKEHNSKEKKNAARQPRKEECQILKDKQQVKKMFDTRPQNEEGKLEEENREQIIKRKKKDKVHCSLSFSFAFYLGG